MGANKQAPEDQIAQGARIGTRNELAPGWRLNREGLSYDPKRRVGGAIYVQQEPQASR